MAVAAATTPLRKRAKALAGAFAIATASLLSPTPAFAIGNPTYEAATDSSTVMVLLGTSQCTGTVIAPQTVLTARHCVPDSRDYSYVVINKHGYTVKDVVVSEETDLALVHTNLPLPMPVTPISFEPRQWGDPGELFGFGTFDHDTFPTLETALGFIIGMVQNVQLSDGTMANYGPTYRAVVRNGLLIPGDSGGPFYVRGQAGSRELAAVASMASSSGTRGYYIPLYLHEQWLRTNAPEATFAGDPLPTSTPAVPVEPTPATTAAPSEPAPATTDPAVAEPAPNDPAPTTTIPVAPAPALPQPAPTETDPVPVPEPAPASTKPNAQPTQPSTEAVPTPTPGTAKLPEFSVADPQNKRPVVVRPGLSQTSGVGSVGSSTSSVGSSFSS